MVSEVGGDVLKSPPRQFCYGIFPIQARVNWVGLGVVGLAEAKNKRTIVWRTKSTISYVQCPSTQCIILLSVSQATIRTCALVRPGSADARVAAGGFTTRYSNNTKQSISADKRPSRQRIWQVRGLSTRINKRSYNLK